ncbi:hypothetical protein JVU11DRAFT_9025 [Chiua virens]|nr:hypothetical protein JVU11DRAFT_9025 [Chiua virens]
MHRRVAHTTAAVIPRTYSTERLSRLYDPARVIAEETNYYGEENVAIPTQESSELSGYDLTTHDDDEHHHWRRLDSRGESILSGLEGPGEELDRMRRSPESMHHASSLNRVAEEDADSAPTDPNDERLEPEDIEEAIEWELEENGLYGGSYKRLLALYTFVPLSASTTFAVLAVLLCLVWPHPSSPSRLSAVLPLPTARVSFVFRYVCPDAPTARSSLHHIVASATPRHSLASDHLPTRVARKPLAPRVPCIVACPS